ncbi:MAG: galactose-1-phosphate uridylyltransferase [Patescibacteria group bacterium]
MVQDPRFKIQDQKSLSELRFDLASGDWVVIATGRAKRPESFKKEKREKAEVLENQCPFCDLKNQETPTLVFSGNKKINFKTGDKIPENWTTVVIPNKYPAFNSGESLDKRVEGNLYQTINALGFHEVVITRNHEKQLARLSIKEIKEVISVYQERYLNLKGKKFVNHISIFHNHGREAGASVEHPHSQIITTPLVDVDSKKSLLNSKEYQKANKKCIYCRMNDWERKVGKRVVFENKYFLVICPFASKTAFEMIISPKKHLTYFEKITEKEKEHLAEAFKVALNTLYKALNDPAYNFYLHTAPSNDNGNHDYYHWHFTILPKTAIPAGFEIGTMMEISTIEPEKAAEYLRKHI